MTDKRRNRLLIILTVAAIGLIAFYMLYQLNPDILFYQLPSRTKRVVAIVIVAVAIAVSTVIFQTIVNNRILTPSIMGLDSVYMFIQTSIIFFAGATSTLLLDNRINYFVSVILLVIFTVLVFKYLFKFTGNNVFLLLLIGIILGTFFGNLASFMQLLIDPQDFMVLQSRMFGSFSSVNEQLLLFTSIIIIILLIIVFKDFGSLDVLALGREHAVNLGVNYDRKVSQLLIIIAILVSISTALVGPIMFLGLLVVNIAHEIFETFRHRYMIIGTMLFSTIALLLGQMVVQFVFNNNIELSIIINLVGGLYFIYLVLKRSQK
ncbi:iron chelate uptake ABC transporter family permease subunit [Aliicoccus persicus]|uniref:Iron complex transport system permease protein n=1 Tax=Aliicoccus persicus TaxID=930138 RepID=A0A662Z341_9STAP|nr:iron chelate uptake ABC transporter family permease subunit [Aliicoccus persicus]SEW00226.1 iron complex transport system permease protein [Aliicoccus persicus]